jgi:hypothetical protein
MDRGPAGSATHAWNELRAIGGMEPAGRDSDLAERLREELDSDAATLDDALLASSTDDLVRAMFSVASPYIQMFSAILKFFRRAKATKGRAQWSVVVDEEHLELRHFEELLKAWEQFECEYDVPAVDSTGSWAMWHASQSTPLGNTESLNGGQEWVADLGVKGLQDWFSALDAGTYTSLPPALRPDAVPEVLKDASAILEASIHVIRTTWPDRDRMLEAIRARFYRHDETDGLGAWTIAKNETDSRIRTSVKVLAKAMRSEPEVLDAFAQKLGEELGRFERRKVDMHASREDLQRLLSLPVWQRRHELYAVWIATEIIEALPDHDCELHHSDGRITFSFGGSVVATIHSSRPKIRLHAERRSPLQGPIGEGRKAGAQPDYSLWRGQGSSETCGLVVEVKHYKKDAPAKFKAVLVDYAKAHPDATVVLVGHGPVGEYVDDRDYRVNGRCKTIGELTVNHLDHRKELANLVRAYVGDPVLDTICRPRDIDAMVVDVSASMASALRSSEMAEFLDEFEPCTEVVLVDTSIRDRCDIEAAAGRLASIDPGGGTSLEGPISELIQQHPRLLVLTDREGFNELSHLGVAVEQDLRLGTVDVVLLRYTGTALA